MSGPVVWCGGEGVVKQRGHGRQDAALFVVAFGDRCTRDAVVCVDGGVRNVATWWCCLQPYSVCRGV